MMTILHSSLLILAISSFASFPSSTSLHLGHQEKSTPKAKVITLDPSTDEYQRVLSGPPETGTMHSGLVILKPGKSVGVHNTEKYEEVLVILEGQGEMRITGGPTMTLGVNSVAYCPPRTEHNVVNTGKGKLRYLYVVAIAGK
jgi:mannose-6-phosphate isomerase-like protein (cupin superfamily)